ncbi:hypothetical protein T01_6478 [Trichinella spiralis]|uniref:Uncharacterized protein n=1 Tax=Trichinella spiralis TaxID=6334 RepID=A0A0V1B6H4_TRISP|nr:hypothetical protein T01_6478 [Trichinella spiralis]
MVLLKITNKQDVSCGKELPQEKVIQLTKEMQNVLVQYTLVRANANAMTAIYYWKTVHAIADNLQTNRPHPQGQMNQAPANLEASVRRRVILVEFFPFRKSIGFRKAS